MVRCFRSEGSAIKWIPSIADQHAFETVDVAEVEKVPSGGGGLLNEDPSEIVEPDVMFENDNEDWDLGGITAGKEVDASGLRGKMCALQEKCRPATVEFPANILAFVALAE